MDEKVCTRRNTQTQKKTQMRLVEVKNKADLDRMLFRSGGNSSRMPADGKPLPKSRVFVSAEDGFVNFVPIAFRFSIDFREVSRNPNKVKESDFRSLHITADGKVKCGINYEVGEIEGVIRKVFACKNVLIVWHQGRVSTYRFYFPEGKPLAMRKEMDEVQGVERILDVCVDCEKEMVFVLYNKTIDSKLRNMVRVYPTLIKNSSFGPDSDVDYVKEYEAYAGSEITAACLDPEKYNANDPNAFFAMDGNVYLQVNGTCLVMPVKPNF